MSKLSNIASVSDASLGSLPPPAREAAPPQHEPESHDEADVRLVIEEDQASGSYVYKTLDRRTGQIIQQFPREEILRLRQEAQYEAGAIFKARV